MVGMRPVGRVRLCTTLQSIEGCKLEQKLAKIARPRRQAANTGRGKQGRRSICSELVFLVLWPSKLWRWIWASYR
jgi:hypothetical protein